MNSIEKKHVDEALERIEREKSVPRSRLSTKHCLHHHGKHFPSKHVVRLAYEIRWNESAEGKFRGGPKIVNFLKSLDYRVDSGSCPKLPGCQDWCSLD